MDALCTGRPMGVPACPAAARSPLTSPYTLPGTLYLNATTIARQPRMEMELVNRWEVWVKKWSPRVKIFEYSWQTYTSAFPRGINYSSTCHEINLMPCGDCRVILDHILRNGEPVYVSFRVYIVARYLLYWRHLQISLLIHCKVGTHISQLVHLAFQELTADWEIPGLNSEKL